MRKFCKDVISLRFTESLKKNYQFRTVYSKGKSIANRLLVIYVLPNGTTSNRLGITVSKKVGNSVVRSRVTRRLRESYRLEEENVKPGYDIVIIARTAAATANYAGLDKAMRYLLKKQGLC